MRVVMFYHSLVSDWNHGNAHFLRGVVTELAARGHDVRVFEPTNGWSRTHLIATQGPGALEEFRRAYPGLASTLYDPPGPPLDDALDGADLVLVHEWNEPALVRAIGRHRAASGGYRLLFHDTHHRSLTAPAEMEAFDLRDYDGVLAFGDVIRDRYRSQGWAEQAWTWHEAADVRVFRPYERDAPRHDLIWIGNWGDDERAAELERYLVAPVERLRLRAAVYGVRYPVPVLVRLARAGIRFEGWIANSAVPRVFARSRLTVHVPRRPYAQALPGIPTIRVFEALACGIPLVSAPWEDCEGLFRPGEDFLVARTGAAMRNHLSELLADPEAAAAMAARGLETILARHTCRHRVDELLAIAGRLGVAAARDGSPATA
jgi:spore maturation protein CgeB